MPVTREQGPGPHPLTGQEGRGRKGFPTHHWRATRASPAQRTEDRRPARGPLGADPGDRLLLRPYGLRDRPAGRPRHQRLRLLEQRQARPARDAGPPGERDRGAAAVPDRPGALHLGAPADAPALHLADPGPERLRHRPQPAQRGGLLHRRHPAAARRARAARSPRPRAEPRLQPGHPDLLGGRRARLGGDVPGELRLADPVRPG